MDETVIPLLVGKGTAKTMGLINLMGLFNSIYFIIF